MRGRGKRRWCVCVYVCVFGGGGGTVVLCGVVAAAGWRMHGRQQRRVVLCWVALCLQAMKCCDVASGTKTVALHRQWTVRIVEELFNRE